MTNTAEKKKQQPIAPKLEGEYTLRIPSQTDNLELIRGFVGKVADKVGFDAEEVNKIELACDEACTNVIKHAYSKDNKESTLDIVIKVDYQKFTLVVTDHGKGFDPKSIKIPDLKQYLAELKVGGLGIYLMKTLMDDVVYDINPGKNNQVTMVKYFINAQDSELHDKGKEK